MKKIMLSIEGMTCSACSSGLEKYLNKQDGIISVSVNLVMANASIEYDEEKLNQEKIEEFIKKAGFQSLGEFKEIHTDSKRRKEKIKFLVFTFLAIILMYISMGHMIHLPTISFLDPHKFTENYMISLLALTICFLIYGLDILINGYKNLIHKTPNMDTLVGIGVITSFLYSLYNMYLVLEGNLDFVESLYFESASIVIYFMKLGRYVDGVSKDKTKEAIQKLVNITPNTAVIKVEGKEKKVTLDEIKKGDTLVCKAGEKIAVDGVVLVGKAHLDESFITGESRPCVKEKGNTVIAGSLNYDGYLEYRAEKIGKDSMVSEIVKLVVEATNTKAPIARLADKVSGYFVPMVIVLALLTFMIYWVMGQSFETALITFVTILVVACPCSLGLATPLAIIVSEGLCATNGILIKKSEILESTGKTNVVVFDKTGTLTYGKLKIAACNNYSDISDRELIQIVGSIERKTTHPIGKAFVDYLEEENVPILEVEEFENVTGYGIIGKVKNQKIMIGNSKWMEENRIENRYQQKEKELARSGNSVVYVARNKEIIASFGVNDIVRPEAKKVVSDLIKMGIHPVMLTGDNKETAHKIASELGIKKVIANVLPKEKSSIIKELKQEKSCVMMCGDGMNDSPALASSDIGVSISSGTDIAMDSSDVILTKNDLSSITRLIHISRKTIKIIKQNLFWAFFYNCFMIPVAMGLLKPFGISISPMIASFSMVLSSMTVVINTLRLKNNIKIKEQNE